MHTITAIIDIEMESETHPTSTDEVKLHTLEEALQLLGDIGIKAKIVRSK